MNFFKRSAAVLERVVTPKVTYTIQDIHNEFDSVEDILLLEADVLIDELNSKSDSTLESKAKDLEKLGFFKSFVVKNSKELNKKIQITKEQADLIREYKQLYPFQKFLTEEELDRICQKYGLIYAPVGNYIEDVPQKNLNEIANAKALEARFRPKNNKYITITSATSFASTTESNFPKEMKAFLKDPIELHFDIKRDRYSNYSTEEILDKLGYKGPPAQWSNLTKVEVNEVSKEGLFIAAPETHFDLSDVSKEKKYGYFKSHVTIVIQDPIVFRYCKGGVQVLSKWGDEASDELLVNPIEN